VQCQSPLRAPVHGSTAALLFLYADAPCLLPPARSVITQVTTTASSGARNKAIERYLFTYNILSSLGWSYALRGTLAYLYREYHKSTGPSVLTRLKHAGRSLYAGRMGRFVVALEGMQFRLGHAECSGVRSPLRLALRCSTFSRCTLRSLASGRPALAVRLTITCFSS
jgi:hypothetical protein